MKGQIFVAGAALIIVLLALIANSMPAASAMPNILSITSQLGNLAEEYRYAASLSAIDKTNHANEFTEYLSEQIQGFDAVYALVLPQSGGYTLEIGNFLKNPTTVIVTATNSNPGTVSASIDDKSSNKFTFTAAGSVELTINYMLQNKFYNQTISFTADESQTILWFDIGIQTSENNIRQSDVWKVEE